jgi:hypothetical protein
MLGGVGTRLWGFGLRFPLDYNKSVASVQPSVADRPPWWLWPTILSLDAPAVVVVWQVLLGRTVSVAVRPAEAAVLGSSVWLAYCADRWIEGWRLPPESIRTHRHRFHQRHRWPMAAVWAAVLCLDIATALGGLSPAEFRAGCLLLLAVAAYLLSHQFVHRRSRWRAPKEICVALLLGAGAAVFIASRPGVALGVLAIPLALFVLLCFGNCALISLWEHAVDRSHGQTSLALQFGRLAAYTRAVPWVILTASTAIFLLGAGRPSTAAACAAASGALLGAIDLAEGRIGRVRARVLADVALMTPAVPLLLRLFT